MSMINPSIDPGESAPPTGPARTNRLLHDPAAPATRSRRRWAMVLRGAAIAAVAVLPLWAIAHWLRPDVRAAEIVTVPVTRGTLVVTVVESGELESSNPVDIRCEVDGQQNKIIFIVPEGKAVKKGETLVQFDSSEFKRTQAEQTKKLKQAETQAKTARVDCEVEKTKAESAVAAAELNRVLFELDRKRYLQGEYLAELNEKKGSVTLSQRDKQDAEEKLKIYRDFEKKGFGTPEQVKLKEQELERARFALERDQERLRVLQEYTFERQEKELTAKVKETARELDRVKQSTAAAIAKANDAYEACERSVELERAEVERIERQIERCTITAPQDGIVVYARESTFDQTKRIQAGATVYLNQTLITLPDLSRMHVKVRIPETSTNKVVPGLRAEIRPRFNPNLVLRGTVADAAPLADSSMFFAEGASKSYVTIVRIDELPRDAGLKPNMNADVTILVGREENALIVPVQAVAAIGQEHYCFVVEPGGVARRAVVLGENNDSHVQIVQGLSEGELVALDARARVAAELDLPQPGLPATTPGEPPPAEPVKGEMPEPGPDSLPPMPDPGEAPCPTAPPK